MIRIPGGSRGSAQACSSGGKMHTFSPALLLLSYLCLPFSALASALFIASHQGCNRVTQLSKSQQCMCMYRAQFPVTCYSESVCFANNLISRNVTKLLQGRLSTKIQFFICSAIFPKHKEHFVAVQSGGCPSWERYTTHQTRPLGNLASSLLHDEFLVFALVSCFALVFGNEPIIVDFS